MGLLIPSSVFDPKAPDICIPLYDFYHICPATVFYLSVIIYLIIFFLLRTYINLSKDVLY